VSTYTPTGEQLDRAAEHLVNMLPEIADRNDARIVTLGAVRACLDAAADESDPSRAVALVARARAQLLALDQWLASR
jgi:hypothetical protein